MSDSNVQKKTMISRDFSASTELHRVLFEEAADGMFITDPHWRYITVNPQHCEITGYSQEELYKITHTDLVSPEDLVRDPIPLEDLSKGKTVTKERSFIRKDGSLIPVEIRARMLPEGNILGIVRDISERKQAEAALAVEKHFSDTIIDAIPGIFVVLDDQGSILRWNKNMEIIEGYTAEELKGMNALQTIVEEDRDRVATSIVEAFEKGHATVNAQILTKDERKIPFLLNGFAAAIGGKRYLVGSAIDMTERKRAEDALASEKQFSDAIIDGIPGIFYVLDDEGNILRSNKNMEIIVGCSAEELKRMHTLDVIAEEDRDFVATGIGKTFEKGYATVIAQMLTKEKRKIPFLFTGLAAMIGGKRYLVGTGIDITTQRKAEEALAAEKQFSDAIIDSIPGIFTVFDDQGNNLRWNKNLETVIGYTAEELKRMNAFQTIAEEDRDLTATGMRETFEKGYATIKARVLTKDNTKIPFLITGLAAMIGGKQYLVTTGIDITERKRAEEAIARERILSDDIINALPGIFYMYDDKGKLVRWNRKHEEVTGYSSEELLGMDVLNFFSEEDKKYILSRVLAVFTEGGSFAEAPLLIKNGSSTPYYFTGRLAIFDERQYLLGVGIDITERKQAEKEKDHLQGQLLQAQKMELVGQLAGGVAHDFNNMLSVIIGYAELALHKTDPAGSVHKSLEKILTAADRSASLTRQLLAFARKQTIAPKVLDLNEKVEGMLKMLQRLIGEDIDLVWQPDSNLALVKMDPTQIDQILANLCINARDAISGAGKVTIETMNAVFDKDYCSRHAGFVCGEYAMFAVSDNGIGMDKETLDKIFEPFFTTKGLGKGTGLGLATVYGIVKQNNGFINVYSEPGKGTTFRIYLPRHLGEALETKTETPPAMIQGRGETILLVEDEQTILEIGTSMLEELGYLVLAAGRSSEAVRLAETYTGEIHLLMTDVVMPEMNGGEVAERIGAIKPAIKCLFMSGYTSNVIAHQGVLEEGVCFIQKPFSLQALAAKVREVLDQGKEQGFPSSKR